MFADVWRKGGERVSERERNFYTVSNIAKYAAEKRVSGKRRTNG